MKARPLFIAAIFLLPNLIGFLTFTFMPVAASAALSFCEWDPVAQRVDEIEYSGLSNYRELLSMKIEKNEQGTWELRPNKPDFWDALDNTLFLMLAIPVNMIGALLLAVLLNQKIRGVVIFRTAFFLPSICAGVGTMLLWMWMFNADTGTVNRVLDFFGIKGPDWLHSFIWAKPALMIMGSWASIGGINMILYLSGLQNIPRELYEAAAMDGAGKFKQLIHVTVPMLTPITFFVLVISIIGGLQGAFEGPYIMTKGAYGTRTMSLYIYEQAFEDLRMGYASAVAWVLFVMVFVVTLINWRIGERRVEY